MSLIYVARPIDKSDGNPKIAYDKIADELVHKLDGTVALYLPALAFDVSGPIDHITSSRLMQINKTALENSSMVLAFYLAGVPSVGVPQEIWLAFMTDKPLIVVTEVPYEQLPVNIKGLVEPIQVCSTLDTAVLQIRELIAAGAVV